jgi:hypothetical protein
MKRDMELIRKILLAVEASETGWADHPLEIEGYDDHTVGYHALLLIEAGLCEGQNVTSSGSKGPEGFITRLTWEGYEFLEAAKEPSRWQEAKDTIFVKLGSASFQVWTAVLTRLMLRSTGLEP